MSHNISKKLPDLLNSAQTQYLFVASTQQQLVCRHCHRIETSCSAPLSAYRQLSSVRFSSIPRLVRL